MQKILVLIPFSVEFTDVYNSIKEAANRSNRSIEVYRTDDLSVQGNFGKVVKKVIEKADLVIVDTSYANPNVLFELGLAEALDKPIITINQRDIESPFDISNRKVILYDRQQLKNNLVPLLAEAINSALDNPKKFIISGRKQSKKKPSAFISYSHADRESLNRMMVHLRPLEKQNLVNIWSDTQIKAGDKWKKQIESALSKAAIAVLLISADFLASEFIIDNELPPLLAAAENKGTRILPIILKPCRFTRDKHLSSFQALNDPKYPLLLKPKIEQEVVWDKLALAIENEIESRSN